MTSSIRGQVAIVGAVDIVSPTGTLGRSTQSLQFEAIRLALADAGLSIKDVNGVAATGSSMGLAEMLGIIPSHTDSTSIGGCSYLVHVEHAALAISSGLCDVAISVHCETPQTARAGAGGRGRGGGGGGGFGGGGPAGEWEAPFGLRQPPGAYALIANRHMSVYGTTPEQLAQVAVSTRGWASKNPNARFQDPITVDDVLNSEMIASPLHMLDCCPVTDGAGCVVMTSAERAKDLKKPPVYVLGAGHSHDHSLISQMPDMAVSAATQSGPKAFATAGIKHSDVDVAQLYDCFTITPIMAAEDLGFCKKGEGGAFMEDGKTGPGGSFPMNTNGGGLSYCHSGMYGMFLLVEAVRQVRGESGPRQVKDANVAVAHGWGGMMGAAATLVLGSAATV